MKKLVYITLMYIKDMATLLKETLDNKLGIKDEWLDTNGLGSYASGSIENCNTRKYHGLLVCKQNNFEEKFVLLSKFDENIFCNGEELYISKNFFSPGVTVPDSDMLLNCGFNQELNPKWIFQNKDMKIMKELLMIHDQDITLIKYTYENLSKDKNLNLAYLNLRPFLAFRNFHHLSKENRNFSFDYQVNENSISYKPYEELEELKITFSSEFRVEEFPCWYKNFRYPEEIERGYDAEEDLACPGVISLLLESRKSVYVAVHKGSAEVKSNLKGLWHDEFSRRAKITKSNNLKNSDLLTLLSYSANQFLIKSKNDTCSVIAGYHWFGEWGRDTMISLPGILLESPLEKEFLKVFKRFLNFKKDGLIPNMIGDDVEHSAYNSVDASLWLFWTLQQFYYKKKCSLSLIKKELWADLKDIIEAYAEGRAEHLHCNSLSLIESGTEKDSLTWMDARVNNLAVTPRRGMVVEINALWFNALSFMEELSTALKDPFRDKVSHLKKEVKNNFPKIFWLDEKGYLADYVIPSNNSFKKETLNINQQLRPNQILAVSLPYSPLEKYQQISIVKVVEEKLLTPFGLRTLYKADPEYKGTYYGDVSLRDGAYHNGTVWTWLLGPFFDALLQTTDNKKITEKSIGEFIENFKGHILHSGYYSISEIFDGDEPHTARGCIAQAWSVAELRRILLEIK